VLDGNTIEMRCIDGDFASFPMSESLVAALHHGRDEMRCWRDSVSTSQGG